MPRRDSQVHKTLSRLWRGSPQPPPVWYPAMLAYPPTPAPPYASAPRRIFDLPKTTTPRQLLDKRPQDIVYPEDEIRQQFFRDHPFEAFRPKSLVEGPELEAEHGVRGVEWVRLRQRGRNPSPEDCIAFALNLHTAHNLPLSFAYSRAVSQYRALRAELSTASTFAALEAEAYGAVFDTGELGRGYRLEEKALETWRRQDAAGGAQGVNSKKWTIQPVDEQKRWTRGQEYLTRLRRGGGPTLVKDLSREQVLLKDSEFDDPSKDVANPDRYEDDLF